MKQERGGGGERIVETKHYSCACSRTSILRLWHITHTHTPNSIQQSSRSVEASGKWKQSPRAPQDNKRNHVKCNHLWYSGKLSLRN